MAQISKRKNNFEMKLPIMKKGLLVFMIFSTLVSSCSEDEPVVPDMGFEYYPLKVGRYYIYQVNETSISQSIETKTAYELKVTISDSTVNERGLTTYVLVREKRANPSAVWQSLDTWSVKLIDNRIVQNEANVIFVKLIFPPSVNLGWDGNQFNNLPDNGNLFNESGSEQYYIANLNEAISLSAGFETDNSLTVVQNDFSDEIVGIDERKEIYASGVGLIYKEVRQLEYCTSSASCLGQQKIDKGVILIQSLKEYGKI